MECRCRLTDKLDKHPDYHDLPCARDTVDQKSSVTAESERSIDSRSKVVVDVDSSPLAHGLHKASTKSTVSTRLVGNEVLVARCEVLVF
jgi:hypothetical protein